MTAAGRVNRPGRRDHSSGRRHVAAPRPAINTAHGHAKKTLLDRAMRGLDAGKDEIPIGLGRIFQIGARVAPKRLFSLINRGD